MSSRGAGSIALSTAEARRLAIAAQGFGARPSTPSIAHIRKLAERVLAFQIDSVNVLVRAHYVPPFARLGPYRMDALDTLAYRKRELFEYWGHAACLLPVSLYPLLRYRMHADETREYMRSDRGAYMTKVYDEVAERGPITAGELSEPGQRSGKWWGWGDGKRTLEHLYNAGLVAIADVAGSSGLYDIAERVIPPAALDAPAPPREEAMKQLIVLGAKACGVGTATDSAATCTFDGWRDRPVASRGGSGRRKRVDGRRCERAREADREASRVGTGRRGTAAAAGVDGWKEPAYLRPAHASARTIDARALVTPFDSLVWDRRRIDRLFGMKYTIEHYTPEPQAGLRLLRLPVPARRHAGRALRPQGRPPAQAC